MYAARAVEEEETELSSWQGGRLAAVRVPRIIGLALCASLALAAPAFGAGHGHHANKVSVKLQTSKQSQLADSSKAKLKVKAKKRAKVVLTLTVKQGKAAKKVAKAKPTVKGTKKLKLKLDGNGKRLIQSCITTKLELTAKSTGGKKLDRDSATMKRDPARCTGSKPAGVDLGDADRCDFISAPGEECLFPYPNDYYTRSDSTTDTGSVSTSASTRRRRTQATFRWTRPTSTRATASARAP